MAFDDKKLSTVLGVLGSLAGPVIGVAGSIGSSFLNEYFYNKRNEHLTGKEQEQNEFNAQQAQINRDWETEMSNTANQRAVRDMNAAGLNPALMYGNGAAASTPTGSNAAGTATVTSPQPTDMASLMNAVNQQRLINAEIKEKEADAHLKERQAVATDTSIDQMKVNIQGSELDNKQKEIVLKYFEEQKQLEIANQKMDLSVKEQQNQKISAEISKMSVEKLKIFAEYLEALESINRLKTLQTLDKAQAFECYAKVGQINQQARYLGIQSDNYDLTQGVKIKLDVGFGPFKAGSEQYLTLPQLREYVEVKARAEENKKNGKENNAGLDYHDYRID